MKRAGKLAAVVGCVSVALATSGISAEPLPPRLQGTWRITRVLPTTNVACWDKEHAAPLLGSTLTYREDVMRWQGGEVELTGIATRTVSSTEFSKENGGAGSGTTPASFTQLGIRSPKVLEVDFQHEDADITGSTTEVPGDSVLVVSPNRIVVSACGVYFEATRAATTERASLRH